MSTNDTVLLLANGAAGGPPLERAELEAFQEALHVVCGELARAIPADGEGATHLISLEVEAAPTARRGPANRPHRGRQPAGEDSNCRSRPELGPDRIGGGLFGSSIRSRRGGIASQWHAALSAGDADEVRRSGGVGFDSRPSRNADRTEILGGSRPHPFLEHRPDGRVCSAQCGLSHLTGC